MRVGAIATIAPVSSTGSLAAPRLRSRIRAIVLDCDPAVALGLSCQQHAVPDAVGLSLVFVATDVVTTLPSFCRNTPHELALLQYTSGSTHEPRGVAIKHVNIIANAFALIDHVPIGATWLPQFHDMGLIGHYIFPIIMGGSSHGIAPSDFIRCPEVWLRMISEHRATFAAAPAFAFDSLLRRSDESGSITDGLDLSSLKVLMAGAEPISAELCRRFTERFSASGLRQGVFVVAYGLAEATLAVTRGSSHVGRFDAAELSRGLARPGSPATEVELCSCGPPLRNLHIDIVCPSTGELKAPGEVGEICISGASVAPFYWHERTVGRVRTHVKTRDLGFMFEGDVYICGRTDDVILQNGQNFYPQDIEQAVSRLLGKRDASVVMLDANRNVTLLIEVRQGRELPDTFTLTDLLASWTGLRIERVVIAPQRSIAYTTSGKVARGETRRRLNEAAIRPFLDQLVPSVSLRKGLSAIDWVRARVSEEPALIDADLGALGADSLRLVDLQLSLEELLEHAPIKSKRERFEGLVLQSCRCGDLLSLADALACKDADRAEQLLESFRSIGAQVRLDEQRCMAADSGFPLKTSELRPLVEPQAVLLTGATGFLGPHLLANLLDSTSLPILVVARGATDDEAKSRIAKALKLVRPAAVPSVAERVKVWRADLSLPDVGLPRARLDELREIPLAIYHNAAVVDYVRNYASLRATNVLGTKAMLELALTGRTTHFHYISSTFIFGWTRKPCCTRRTTMPKWRHLTSGIRNPNG